MNHTIAVILSANATTFAGQMAMASAAVSKFDNVAATASTGSSKFAAATKVAGAAVAVTLAAALVSGVRQFMAFEVAMRNVNSISELSEAQFQRLGESVLQMSRELPQSAQTLAEGLYEIASSGYQGAEGLKILEASAKAATAGMTDTQTSAKAIVSVINAYGLSAADAAAVSDTLFQTVKVGILSFHELATQLGDVVGIAAAAGVSIEEVGAAMAGMTLSGISAAESSTSLRRLLQSLIDPSKELKALYKDLGFESGVLAIEQYGLHGVMEQIRVATGGNVEAFLKLFPEIRAARGAFALAAASGQNYAKAVAAVENASNRAGATQRALDEQMKAAGNQLKLFVNNFNAAAITVGQKFVPVMMQGLDVIGQVAGAVVNLAQELGGRLTPFWKSLGEIMSNVWGIATTLTEAFGPLAAAIAGVAVYAVIEFLNAFAGALADVTGFLNEHKTVVMVIAALLAGQYVSSLMSAANATRVMAAASSALRAITLSSLFQEIALRAMYMADAFRSGAGAAGILRAGLQGISAGAIATTAGFAAVIGGAAAAVIAFRDAGNRADEMVDKITQDIDYSNYDTVKQAIYDLSVAAYENSEAAGRNKGIWGQFTDVIVGTAQVLSPLKNTLIDSAAAADAAGDAANAASDAWMRFNKNVGTIAQELGTSRESVIGIAKDMGVLKEMAGTIDPTRMAELTVEIGKAVVLGQQAPAVAGLAGAFDTLGDAASTSSEKVNALKSALDNIIGIPQSVFDATTSLEQSFIGLGDAVVAAGGNFNSFDEAGMKVRGMLSANVDAAEALAVAVANQEGSVGAGVDAFLAYRDRLSEVLTKAGLTTDQIADLYEQFGMTPEAIELLINSKGVETSKEQLDLLYEEAAALDALEANPTVSLTDNATTQAGAIESLMLRIAGFSATPTVDVNTGSAEEKVGGLVHDLLGLGSGVYVPTADLNKKPAEAGIAETMAGLYNLGAQTPTPTAFLEIGPLTENQRTVVARLQELAGMKPTPIANMVIDPANAKHRELVDKLTQMGLMRPVPVVNLQDNASGPAQRIKANIDAIPANKTVTVTTRHVDMMDRKGVNRWGGIQAYRSGGIGSYDMAAAGGLMHRAHIARAQRIKYAEPQTGGEAYIPRLGNTMRSLAILRTVAREWFGKDLVDVATTRTSSYRQAISAKPWETAEFLENKLNFERAHAPKEIATTPAPTPAAPSMGGSGGFNLSLANGMVQVSVRADASVDGGALAAQIEAALAPAMTEFSRNLVKELKTRSG